MGDNVPDGLGIFRLLIQQGAYLNHQNKDGHTAFALNTAKSHNLDQIKLLVDCGADLNQRSNIGMTVLHSVIVIDIYRTT